MSSRTVFVFGRRKTRESPFKISRYAYLDYLVKMR